MSEEDAAQVRRAYEVWNDSGPAAVIEQFWAEDGVYRGESVLDDDRVALPLRRRHGDELVVEVAALVGDTARATMLNALMGGRSLTGT